MLFPEFEYAVADSAAAIVRIERNGVRNHTSHMKMEAQLGVRFLMTRQLCCLLPSALSIWCRSEDEEDSVYSNYEERKLYIHEEDVGNKGETRGGT